MAIVSIYEAKQGMVLQKEVFDLNTGRIILSSGTKLTERNIEQLKELKISFIEIESAQNTEKAEEISLEVEDFMTKEEKITFYAHRLCDDLESLFIMIRNGKKIVVGQISKSLDRIVDILLEGDDIIKKIKIANLSDVDYTIRHSVHVCFYATMVGKWLNYDRIRIKQLAFSGLLHDIGKSKIPEYILDKPNKLTEKEYEIVKKHVVYGYNMLKETVGIGQAIAYGALQHHERENGTGYPLGISSDQIHQFAKIIAVCDVFDAMTSDRVFKEKQSLFLVAEIIQKDSFDILDPQISLLFLNHLSKFYVGNRIRLSDKREGNIVYINKTAPTRPVVKVDDEYIDLSTNRKFFIEEML